MKRLIVPAFILPLLLAPLLAVSAVRGSGTARTERRDVKPFTEIELAGTGTMIVTRGDAAALEVTADDNLLPLIVTVVEGNRLAVSTKEPIAPRGDLIYKVTVPDLRKVTVSGAAELRVEGLSNEALEVKVSGAAKVRAAGQTGTLTLDLSGASDVDATKLQAKTGKVSVTGAGKVELFASESLDVSITGAGSVRYAGEPKTVNKRMTGVGSLQKL